MINKLLKQGLLLSILFTLLVSCTAATPTPTPTPQPTPYWPVTDWRTSTPEAQGIDSGRLVEMLEDTLSKRYDLDSIVLIRHGYMVADVTYSPFTGDERHMLYSCTKSVVSALIGMAIEKGYIESIDQPLLDFFPERSVENLDENKQAITLEHVLTMTTGLECRDSFTYNFSGLIEMRNSDDWVQYVLNLPMLNTPGTYFEYCNGASFLLSAIIQETTGMTAHDFAQENLFAPLGITDTYWEANLQGINLGYSDLYLLPQDMAKFGYLYLHEGVWDGEQIVPTAWVEASTQEHISSTLQDGYGYQWWVDDAGYYMALGYRGQFIFVLPGLDMVVVIVSDPDVGDYEIPEYLLTTYIIPAVLSNEPLTENPESYALLEAIIEEIANPESQE
jgi:CubicO group peptidase (beta-lactamase class C family)